MKKEYDLKKMKMKPVGTKFKGAKIAKTFRIDLDIFHWLYEESQRTGIPYQALMNSKLKMLMDQEKVREVVREEIEEAS